MNRAAALREETPFRRFARTAALHHEKLDGSGYPFGATGDAIDLPARILVVSDIHDALTSDRPYRRGMTAPQATQILESERGTKLCPIALDALSAVRLGAASHVNPWSPHTELSTACTENEQTS